jgi:methionyl-tRNA synthetase
MVFEQFLLGAASGWLLAIFMIVVVWDTIWKGIALWKSGRSNQLAWFICILILNTAGILPIIYLVFFQKKKRK